MSKVDFISCPPFSFKKEKIIRVLKKYAADEGYSIKKIQYNFLEEPSMLKMKKSYLGHDSHTDIITFDYSENMSINAEVYISIDMMKENAKKFNQRLFWITNALNMGIGVSPNQSNVNLIIQLNLKLAEKARLKHD